MNRTQKHLKLNNLNMKCIEDILKSLKPKAQIHVYKLKVFSTVLAIQSLNVIIIWNDVKSKA